MQQPTATAAAVDGAGLKRERPERGLAGALGHPRHLPREGVQLRERPNVKDGGRKAKVTKDKGRIWHNQGRRKSGDSERSDIRIHNVRLQKQQHQQQQRQRTGRPATPPPSPAATTLTATTVSDSKDDGLSVLSRVVIRGHLKAGIYFKYVQAHFMSLKYFIHSCGNVGRGSHMCEPSVVRLNHSVNGCGSSR